MRLIFLFAVLGNADIYLQHPCGSNNRLDDENRDRNNADRLMDTQNNNRGGYNVGNVFYIGGTKVPMKWTAQHSCGQANNNCEIIVQMMCDKNLRDGTTTKTIPDNPIECYNWDCDTDVRYGRHESFTSYQICKKTERNKGLFLADQNVKGHAAIYTRQNPNGARRGYECPEERDYYPYWRPSEWVDLAYFTNDYPAKCEEVIVMSNKPKAYCAVDEKYLYMKDVFTRNNPLPITQKACESETREVPVMETTVEDGNEVTKEVKDSQGETILENRNIAVWRTEEFSDDKKELLEALGPISCLDNQWSRDNHHGNIEGGYFAGYEWTVPDIDREGCAFRIRYNISTTDLPAFQSNLTTPDIVMENEAGEVTTDLEGRYYVGEQLGFTKEEIAENGYYYKTNPQVAPFYNYPDANAMDTQDGSPLKFQLAVNTAQFGRTFQDRSHRFSIRKKPASLQSATVHTLGVRGKRGNIVQVYPATEYSFQPEKLDVKLGDYLQIQFVGSNTNPNNNAGQGRQGSDRHNIAQLRNKVYPETGQEDETLRTFGQFGSSYPEHLANGPGFLGFSLKDRQKLASLKGVNTNGGELSELDDSGTWASFDFLQVTAEGIFNYLCTRNNNFSNRSQKGRITSKKSLSRTSEVEYSGAVVVEGSSKLEIGEGSAERTTVELETVGHKDSGWCSPCASSYYLVANPIPVTETGSTLSLSYEERAARHVNVWHTTSNSVGADKSNWNKIENAECEDGVCTFPVSKQGIYVIDHAFDWWVYFLSVLSVVLCIIVVLVAWKCKKSAL